MKKILLALGILATTTIYAQEKKDSTNSQRQNDIMLSPIELIAVPALNISYERLINKDNAIGVNFLSYLKNDSGYSISQISPYYRMYFGEKFGSGFFVEGFLPITTTKDTSTYTFYDINYSEQQVEFKRTSIGIGVGFGGKWATKRNIIFEASIGIARRIGDKTIENNTFKYESSNLTGKGMLGIGYRF